MSKQAQLQMARYQADMDWMKVGTNENPYNVYTQPREWREYEKRFDQISHEWDNFVAREA